ncbi:MAG: WGR domain-containing protein [Sulfitobacter sp.]
MFQSSSSAQVQLEVFPDRLKLCRVDPDKNMNRYYFMTVQRDLFGGASLIKEWGRIGSGGKVHVSRHADEGQAVDMLADLVQRKTKRGYKVHR